MNRTADLEVALRFVTGRLGEEATQSGEPLTEEQIFLLNNLPSFPLGAMAFYYRGQMSASPVPRDFNYERLCALGKAAYLSDRKLTPSLDWEFALAVFKLNNHPMHGLLKWAGVRQRRPASDVILLIVAALLLVPTAMALILLLLFVGNARWPAVLWVGIGLVYLALLLGIYSATRRMEQRQLEKQIDKCRLYSRFAGTAVNHLSK
jgi:hypothetical protein